MTTEHEPIPTTEDTSLAPELQRVDRLLAEDAARQAMPTGLSDRVFAASVAYLPRPVVNTEPERGFRREPITTPEYAAVIVRPRAWGRMALAASMGLAFIFAARVVIGPSTSEIVPIPIWDLEEAAEYGGQYEDADSILEQREITIDDVEADLDDLRRAIDEE